MKNKGLKVTLIFWLPAASFHGRNVEFQGVARIHLPKHYFVILWVNSYFATLKNISPYFPLGTIEEFSQPPPKKNGNKKTTSCRSDSELSSINGWCLEVKMLKKPLLTLNFWQGKRSKQRNYHHWASVYLAQLPRCQAQHVSLQSLNCREPVRVSKRRLPLIKDYCTYWKPLKIRCHMWSSQTLSFVSNKLLVLLGGFEPFLK